MTAQPMTLFGVVRGFFRAVWRAVRQLFHEITGTFFILIAISGAQSAWRSWHRGAAHWLLGLTCGYVGLMLAFGILAFRDSRRVQ